MKRNFFSLLILFSVLFVSVCKQQKQVQFSSKGPIGMRLTQSQAAFLDTLQYRTFLYFWNECNPENGLVRDRSTKTSPASTAATGFGVAAWIVGAEHGWITRAQARERVLNLLRFLNSARQSPDSLATGYQGFFYHFLDMKTGLRTWHSELSSIDTAWLLAGIRFARQYFSSSHPDEQQIRQMADQLTFNVNWDFLTIDDAGKYHHTIALGWYPEKGLHHMGWIGYNEAQYLYVLAAGSGYEKAEKAYQAWLSTYEWFEPYKNLGHVGFAPLFGHQYTQIFLDLRGLVDDYMKQKKIDYFENSRRATLSQRQYGKQNPLNWKGYDSLTWGWTACDGPGPKYNFDDRVFHYYSARGMIGTQYIQLDDGTIAPTAAGGSIVFVPEIGLNTLMSMYERFKKRGIWGKYGFVDAFNLTVNWFDKDYLGIDQGPILLMIENLRSGLIWKYCMEDEVIQNGLARLNFAPVKNIE